MNKFFLALSILLISASAFPACRNASSKTKSDLSDDGKGKKKDKKAKERQEDNSNATPVQVLQRWEMPDVLTEISDIDNIDDHSFAAIQDESGTIFIYNLDRSKIDREIPFAGKGDYEGIAIAGNTCYVLKSNGDLFEVSNYKADKPTVTKYKTFLNSKDDAEALCYDKKHNRLLLAFKAEEGNGGTKGIYSFDLQTKSLQKDPVYSIDIQSLVPEGTDLSKKKNEFRPSAIAIHPTTGELYLLEGTHPKLLIADTQGKVKSLSKLDSRVFLQPEGITFNSAGALFISNEGQSGKGNILKVKP